MRSRPWWGFGSGGVWWLRVLVVALLPLGARGGAVGLALSPWWWVVVVVTISLGSVKGRRGRGLGFGCGR